MSAHILHGFKCYLCQSDGGSLFGVVAVDPFHPWHGWTDERLPIHTFETGLRESVTFKRGGSNDWLIVFEAPDGVSNLQRVAEHAKRGEDAMRPPDFMIEEFKDAYLDEMQIMGMTAPADRIETWRSFVSVCVANKVISKHRARHMRPPRELFQWEI